MTSSRSARPFGRTDIHVHIGRLVVDRSALAASGVRGLHDEVIDRITHRLDGGAGEADAAPAGKPGLSDAIAAAVAGHVSPRLDVARARRRR